MGRRNQFSMLIRQELRQAFRSRYMLLSFILLPLFMWAFQGGIQFLMISVFEGEPDGPQYQGMYFYVVNNDEGNTTHNMGQVFIDMIESRIKLENCTLYGARIKTDYTSNFSGMVEDVRNNVVSPVVYIPHNFTEVYQNFNGSFEIPIINIITSPSDRSFAGAIFSVTWQIINQPPFTEYHVHKKTELYTEIIVYEGEEDAGNSFILGFIGFLVVILAVMAPAPFVASSFAGEKEKKTLESLLVLPMSRFDILGAKLVSGLTLIGIFAVMNSVGMFAYQLIVNSAEISTESEVLTSGFEISFSMVMSIFAMVLLTSFIAIGFGIAIASLAKDSKAAEGQYMLIMLFPAMIVGMSTMLSGIPTSWSLLYLLPWTHSLAIINKSMYPLTYSAKTLTGSIVTDLIFHLGYLFLFVVGSLYLASKIFDRESLIKG